MTEPSDDIEETLEMNPLPSEEDFEDDDEENPESKHAVIEKAKKKIDPTGAAWFGELFLRYQKLEEIRDLVPAFKEFYYERMIKDTGSKVTHIVKDFNLQLQALPEPRLFHPYTTNILNWKKKWDKDILAKKGMALEVIDTKKHVQQVMRTRLDGSRDGAVEYNAPGYSDLELGVQTLGGELMNDAMQMLNDDRDLEDIYESDELIKRRNYILTVFTQVTKMVQGKAGLMLKTSEEKRNTANFLMDLMKKSTAGKMSIEEINALRVTYTPPVPQHDSEFSS